MNSSTPIPPAPVLAEVVRSGFVEGYHRGSLVLLAPDGTVELALGTPERPVFPRSSNKPFQAVATLRAGLELPGELLALAAASHAGEDFHLAGVRAILAGAGLSPADLRTPPDLPLDRDAAERHLAAGGTRQPLLMNCSGKHAGWLAAGAGRGWSTADYLDPAHPVQLLAREAVQEATGEEAAALGTDGCGAPLIAVSLLGLARGFRALLQAPEGSAPRRVADAMRAHPQYVAGTARLDTWLMRAVPGALSKAGAEAVQAVALPDGRALAVKIEDGNGRALGPVLAALLVRLGHRAQALAQVAAAPLYGGGAVVGEVRAVL
ncbi:asparaginase [Streptomyces tateyamensis]|uniref:Asparaginase n=1 Tax=Streptomyces tateyamensis TaxID=565073 RepID=A0A2V4P600_9ACTN|nr:asparaginase [Streptomyces tateyamensis]PYC85442.1 asparaginase [Streptomyces tateyamensis]